jgi:hypothetical protein
VHGGVLQARAGQPGQRERRESATDVRLDGDEMAPDADDGDAGHFRATYMEARGRDASEKARCRRRAVDSRSITAVIAFALFGTE